MIRRHRPAATRAKSPRSRKGRPNGVRTSGQSLSVSSNRSEYKSDDERRRSDNAHPAVELQGACLLISSCQDIRVDRRDQSQGQCDVADDITAICQRQVGHLGEVARLGELERDRCLAILLTEPAMTVLALASGDRAASGEVVPEPTRERSRPRSAHPWPALTSPEVRSMAGRATLAAHAQDAANASCRGPPRMTASSRRLQPSSPGGRNTPTLRRSRCA